MLLSPWNRLPRRPPDQDKRSSWKDQTVNSVRLALVLAVAFAASAPLHAACPALLAHTLPRLQDEKPVDLCDHAGKVVLVVNTASQCGFTPQYKALEALSDRYRSRGLVVLGFPSNDFGGQEPAANAQIAEFCESQFGVAQKSGATPQWNFHKYLIDRRGETVSSHLSEVDPLGPAFVREVEKLLGAK
jgi:glutathione peroxidase